MTGLIGLGVDLVDIDRLRLVLSRSPSLLERLFTPEERAYAARATDPAERLAVRFAAKEAVMKALGVGLGGIDWHDVEVSRDDDTGAPSLRLRGRARARADAQGVSSWLVSLSHTATLAEAVVAAT